MSKVIISENIKNYGTIFKIIFKNENNIHKSKKYD